MTNSYEFLGKVRLLSSLTHGGESTGSNESLLRRERFVGVSGIVELPVVSGNAIRGVLRDIGMRHFCQLLADNGSLPKLSMAAFYFLFSGGSPRQRTSGAKAENLPWVNRLRELIPLVSVFGGVDVNWIPGRLKVGKMIPICKEIENLLPEAHRSKLPSIYDLIQQEMYTRRADESNERNAKFLDPDVKDMLQRGASGKELADSSVATQMIYYVETLCAGTELSWRVILEDVTDVELGAFTTCLAEWAKNPHVGGKSGIGHGLLAIEGTWFRVDPYQGHCLAESVQPCVEKYLQVVGQNTKEILELLASIKE